jgi:hypothetical protein
VQCAPKNCMFEQIPVKLSELWKAPQVCQLV